MIAILCMTKLTWTWLYTEPSKPKIRLCNSCLGSLDRQSVLAAERAVTFDPWACREVKMCCQVACSAPWTSFISECTSHLFISVLQGLAKTKAWSILMCNLPVSYGLQLLNRLPILLKLAKAVPYSPCALASLRPERLTILEHISIPLLLMMNVYRQEK